ncbi:hypothetical protein SAMN05216319_2116 [Duganella sp. CF402]|uniref:glycosyl-4,4'-diaponeurosporenoate acyltransferase CrtO family protein n=1 Tax=unclassified Duganella TaxID=2636909 RepID=UPI0008B60815|nr:MULTISPECIES: hypothetical protein [unclassified Duganella]RZT09457.1 hypothetical protein EV582_1507 [Duganella sp. BK701]SEL56619.1 hypothetical protein SAMN05216319_2116 [Duganella sp. CF402]
MQFLGNPIAVMFLSFIIGVIADLVLRRMPFYSWISARYVFADSKTYEILGVGWFRKILLATPLRMFNTNIKLPKNRDLQLLKEIRKHIATAEVSHWVGFAVMMVATIYAWSAYGPKTGVSFVFFNTVGNLYPCLLQQYNKRRLYQLIAVMEQRAQAAAVSPT